jgi:hypothetical protein
MVGRLVDGTADVPTILSSLDRVMHRLTSDNTRLATQRPAPGAQSGAPALDFSLFSLFGPGVGEPNGSASGGGPGGPGVERTTR